MGAAAGVASAGSSIASIGLQYFAGLQKVQGDTQRAQADVFRAQGESNADTYQAERLDVAAQYGDLKASQTAGQMTRNLSSTLQNIHAVRAAAGADPASPTGAAIMDYTRSLGFEKEGIEVGNINAQTNQERSDAAYYRTASANALLSGNMAFNADMTAARADQLSNYAGMFGTLSKGTSGLSSFSMPKVNVPGFNPIAGVTGQ